MKKKFILVSLLGCLLCSLVACGDVPTSEEEVNSIISEELSDTVENELVENVVEEVVEEVIEDSWPDYMSDSFRPVFESHPILQGRVLLGGSYEEVRNAVGEPNDPEDDVWLEYYITNSAGVKILNRFQCTRVSSPDETYVTDTNEFKTFYIEEGFFDVDNEDMLISRAAYEETYEIQYNSYFDESIELPTYEDIVEKFGTPGFVTGMDTASGKVETIEIMWIITDPDEETGGKYLIIEFRANGSWYGMDYPKPEFEIDRVI